MAKRTRTALREEARRKGARLDERSSVRNHREGRRPGLVKKLRRKRVGFVEGSEVSPHRLRQRAQSRCSPGTKLPIERRKTRNLLMSGQQAGGKTSATALVQPDNCCASNAASSGPQVKRARTIPTEPLEPVAPAFPRKPLRLKRAIPKRWCAVSPVLFDGERLGLPPRPIR